MTEGLPAGYEKGRGVRSAKPWSPRPGGGIGACNQPISAQCASSPLPLPPPIHHGFAERIQGRWRASAPAISGHRMLAGCHRLDACFQSSLDGRSQMSSFGSACFTFVSYALASPGGPDLGPERDVMDGAGVGPGALASSDMGSVDILAGKPAEGCHRSPWLERRMPSAAGKPNCIAAATIDLSRL